MFDQYLNTTPLYLGGRFCVDTLYLGQTMYPQGISDVHRRQDVN